MFGMMLLTVLAVHKVTDIFSCVGVKLFGLSKPKNAQNRSTYVANPNPNTSLIVFPRAAAAIVDKHI